MLYSSFLNFLENDEFHKFKFKFITVQYQSDMIGCSTQIKMGVPSTEEYKKARHKILNVKAHIQQYCVSNSETELPGVHFILYNTLTKCNLIKHN